MTAPVFIHPDWPAPAGIEVLSTTRIGGHSTGPYAGFNLGEHAGDDPHAVAANRALLETCLPAAPHWLKQVHGKSVIHLADWHPGIEADAAWTDRPGQVVAIQTADCLPVVFAPVQGGLVAAAHAGWRGLAGGVLEATIAALPAAAEQLQAWIGPGIGPAAFEVGSEVRAAFVARNRELESYFVSKTNGKYQADLPSIARELLHLAGVGQVSGGDWCTASDPERFFSHRRDRVTGRMATLAWLESVKVKAKLPSHGVSDAA